MIEEKDRLLLSHLQKGLPLVSRPFAVLGAKTGLAPAEVLLSVEKLRAEGSMRGICAFWNHLAFGYRGSWAAMRFPEQEVDAKAEILGRHPGVIYAAEREHDLNLWLFIATPPGHDPETHLRILERLTNSEAAVFLPLRRALKGMSMLRTLDPVLYEHAFEHYDQKQGPEPGGFLYDEIKVIRALQGEFPVTDEPFRKLAEAAAISSGRVLEILNGLVRKGYLRRIGAEISKRTEPPGPLAFVVWQIPEEKREKAELFFEEVPEIVHADLRSSDRNFPFTVHTLVRVKDEPALELLLRKIEDGIGKWPHRTVPFVREVRKTPMKYFPKDLDGWWVKHRSLADPALDSVRS